MDIISSSLGCPSPEDKRCAYDERNEQNGFSGDVLHGVLLLGTSIFYWLMLNNKNFFSKNFLLFYSSAGFNFLPRSSKKALLIRPKMPCWPCLELSRSLRSSRSMTQFPVLESQTLKRTLTVDV